MSYAQPQVKLVDFSGLASLVKKTSAYFKRRALVRKTYKELSELSNRELLDMGISRCSIRSIAEGTYYDEKRTFPVKNDNLRGWV
mgnify:CR=1 FL=1